MQAMLAGKFARFFSRDIALEKKINLILIIKKNIKIIFQTWSSKSALFPIKKMTVFGDAWLVASVSHASKWLNVLRRVIS